MGPYLRPLPIALVLALAGLIYFNTPAAATSPSPNCVAFQASGQHSYTTCKSKLRKAKAHSRAPFRRAHRRYSHHRVHAQHRLPSLAGIVEPLAEKTRQIVQACSSHVISAVRHTFIKHTKRISLHAYGKAVDLQGNPSCMYSLLHAWPGGYSTDYQRVKHIHLSYDPQSRREWGARFVHGGHHIKRLRKVARR